MYKKGLSLLCVITSVILAFTAVALLSKFGLPLGWPGSILLAVVIRLVLYFVIEDGVSDSKAIFRYFTKKQGPTTGTSFEPNAPPEKVYLEKPWEFEFVRTDEEMRKIIVDHVRENYTSSDQPYLMQLNLAYGVMERTNGIFLTMTYFVSRGIIRADYKYDLEKYVLLRGDKAYMVERYKSLSAPLLYAELAKQAIAHYENREERRAFEEELKAADPELDLGRLNYQLRQQYFRN